ncbi:MAG TPA: shikimate kinase [Thermodesulfobacteriota bacterium]
MNRINIVLTGFMGTGKSTVGRLLSRRLGLRFVDIDELIEAEAGMTIAAIFSSKGEPAFREMEAAMVKRLASGELGEGLVVSTGGGVVMLPENRELLKGWGTLVCLKASVEEILRRVGERTDRPLLARPDRKEAITTLLREREEAYRDCDIEIDTTGRSIDDVAAAVEKLVKGKENR